MHWSPVRSVALAAACCAMAPSLHAQSGGHAVGLVASTLGLGGEVTLRLDRTFSLRGGYYLFSFDRQAVVEDIAYDIQPKLRHGAVRLDVHPFGTGFRLSTGAVLSSSRAEGTAVLAGPVTIGGQTWQPEDVGRLFGRGEYDRSLMPYLGLGLTTGGRVGVTLDAGVAFSGHPEVRLTVDSPLQGTERAILEQSVAQEEAEINQSIRDRAWARFYPVVAVGVRVRL